MAPSHLFLATIYYSGRNAHYFIFMHILLILYFLFHAIYQLALGKKRLFKLQNTTEEFAKSEGTQPKS